MTRAYTTNCGQYVLSQDGKEVGPLLDEVSLVLNVMEGGLVKHGNPKAVVPWFQLQRMSLVEAGCDAIVDGLVCITGRFPVAEINRLLENGTAAGDFYRRLTAGELAPQPLLEPPPATAQPSPFARRRPAFR